MLHGLLQVWFGWVRDGGYLGVIALMAMESSIFPVPSEIVIPPAAFWASQGRMSYAGVILAGTFGSWLGSAITYWVSRWIGRAVILRWGRIVPREIEAAVESCQSPEDVPMLRRVCQQHDAPLSRLLLLAADRLDWPKLLDLGSGGRDRVQIALAADRPCGHHAALQQVHAATGWLVARTPLCTGAAHRFSNPQHRSNGWQQTVASL